MSRILDVYLYDQLAGELLQDDDGMLCFRYAENYLSGTQAFPLSQSLPLQKEQFKGKVCHAFFGGLLPEAGKRKLIAFNLGISANNDFSMLEKIGGECAGAITFLPKGEVHAKKPKNTDYALLSDDDLAGLLRELSVRPLLAGKEGMRLSLTGAQDKIAVTKVGNNIYLPLHGAPSTHIIKPAINHFPDIALNEAFCLRLAEAVGIPSARVEPKEVQDISYLLVERYDRHPNTVGLLERLHQEDFCQALAISSENKYQSEGGPSLVQCFELVRRSCTTPAIDLKNMLDTVIFNFLIGNNDAHGKNFSLLYKGLQVTLAPCYDILSTMVYPELSKKTAMKIGDTYDYLKINNKEWEKMSKACGFSVAMVKSRIKEVKEKILDLGNSVADHLPHSEIIQHILKRVP